MTQLSFDFMDPLRQVAVKRTLDEDLGQLAEIEQKIATHYSIRPPGVRRQIFNAIKLMEIPETSEVHHYLMLYASTRALLLAQGAPIERLQDAS